MDAFELRKYSEAAFFRMMSVPRPAVLVAIVIIDSSPARCMTNSSFSF